MIVDSEEDESTRSSSNSGESNSGKNSELKSPNDSSSKENHHHSHENEPSVTKHKKKKKDKKEKKKKRKEKKGSGNESNQDDSDFCNGAADDTERSEDEDGLDYNEEQKSLLVKYFSKATIEELQSLIPSKKLEALIALRPFRSFGELVIFCLLTTIMYICIYILSLYIYA